jgi:Spy/CpxP family protein refolding chaperone
VNRFFKTGLLVCVLGVGFAPAVRAQEGEGGNGGGQRRQRPSMVDQLKQGGIDLTEEQTTKVKALEEKMRADMQSLRQNGGGREEMAKLFEQLNKDVRGLLTAEQQPKFDEWAKQQAERRAQRGNRGGGQDTPAPKPTDLSPIKVEKEINLGEGGFDYLKANADSRKLYVSHSSKVDVIDMDKNEKIGEVLGVEGSHGIAISTDGKLGFATAGRKTKVVVFDTETNKVTKEVDTGKGPDAIIFASSVNEAWSINHSGGNITCIDAKTLEVTKTIDVGGTLEFACEDPQNAMVFVNVENKGTVVAIDAKKHEIKATYTLADGAEPTGIAIDAKAGILFVGTGNKHLFILESATGKILATKDIGDHCDAVAFDEGTKTCFASCGDGYTYVIHEKDATTFESLKTIETARGGKCCAVDQKTHKLYIAVAPRRNEKGESKVLVFTPEVPSGKTF